MPPETQPTIDTAPLALVTGVSRNIGIGATIARRLHHDGLRVATTGWRRYDQQMPWGADTDPLALPAHSFDVDLADADATAGLVPTVNAQLGTITALVMCHAESIDSDIQTTTIDSFDRHMAINARASWQLIKAFANQYEGPLGSGRIIALTSDHTAGNLPYGASKGALDRIVLAAAVELAEQRITANVINPGPTDTGWMTADVEQQVRQRNLQPRIGLPADVANLVSFLCSSQGSWINGQLLHSNGGLR